MCKSNASEKKIDELATIPVYFSGNYAINSTRYTNTACEQRETDQYSHTTQTEIKSCR